MPRLFQPFAARLMISYAPAYKPTLTKRDLSIHTYHHALQRQVLSQLGFTRRYPWGLHAGAKILARHATEREVELGRIALVRSSNGCSVGRRWWRLDEAVDQGGTLTVFSPSLDGEFWYDVGSIRLNVGDPLPEVRERVKAFLRSIPPIPRYRSDHLCEQLPEADQGRDLRPLPVEEFVGVPLNVALA